jgi:ligand-binding sensor protein
MRIRIYSTPCKYLSFRERGDSIADGELKELLDALQNIQDEFSDMMGSIIVTTDRKGELITKMSGLPKACQIIRGTKKGLESCDRCYHSALALAGKEKNTVIMECPFGFVALYVPIIIDGKAVGSVTGCGGMFAGKGEDETRERYLKYADDLGIQDKDGFVEVVLKESKVASRDEIERRTKVISASITSLAQETALKKVFEEGLGKSE